MVIDWLCVRLNKQNEQIEGKEVKNEETAAFCPRDSIIVLPCGRIIPKHLFQAERSQNNIWIVPDRVGGEEDTVYMIEKRVGVSMRVQTHSSSKYIISLLH